MEVHAFCGANCENILEVLQSASCVVHRDLEQCYRAVAGQEHPLIVLSCASEEDLAKYGSFEPGARIALLGSTMGAVLVKKGFSLPGVQAVVNGFGTENDAVARNLLGLFLKKSFDEIDSATVLGVETKCINFSLKNSSERSDILDAVEALIVENLVLARSDAASIYAQRVIGLLDEVMLNAVFAANPELVDADRSQSWPLEGRAVVNVSCAFSKDTLAIGVFDSFGSLEKPAIVKHVCDGFADGISNRRSGGLGTRLVYDGSTSILYLVSPGRFTKVFIVVRAVPSQKQFKSNPKSIGFFLPE